MQHAFLLAAGTNLTWFLFPLAAVISLVYSASRYELPERILKRALRHFLTIIIVMSLLIAILMFFSFHL